MRCIHFEELQEPFGGYFKRWFFENYPCGYINVDSPEEMMRFAKIWNISHLGYLLPEHSQEEYNEECLLYFKVANKVNAFMRLYRKESIVDKIVKACR